MALLFYTTSQCHLCELAEALLVSTPMPEPIPVDVVDIALVLAADRQVDIRGPAYGGGVRLDHRL